VPAHITVEFPPSINLPATGSSVNIEALGISKEYFRALSGKVQTGNIIKIESVFAGRDAPTNKQLEFELVFKNL